ncbi:hypothetical protein JAAARDRAFT_51897, partial [Jaapia argillacea MUCL 33604]
MSPLPSSSAGVASRTRGGKSRAKTLPPAGATPRTKGGKTRAKTLPQQVPDVPLKCDDSLEVPFPFDVPEAELNLTQHDYFCWVLDPSGGGDICIVRNKQPEKILCTLPNKYFRLFQFLVQYTRCIIDMIVLGFGAHCSSKTGDDLPTTSIKKLPPKAKAAKQCFDRWL